MAIYLIILILINLLSFLDVVKIPQLVKKIIYIIMAVIFVLLVGFRGSTGTDTGNYIKAFGKVSIITASASSVDYIYSDKGFILLTSVLKNIYNNNNFYFLTISLMTIYCLFFSLYKTTKYVMLGIFIYYIRFFFLRDLNQIRASFAIGFLLISIIYAKQRKIFKFLKLNFLAIIIHKSSLIWLGIYKILNKKISQKNIFNILFLCFIFNNIVYKNIGLLNVFFENLGINRAYTTGEFGLSASQGYKNPILYYQLLLFLTYLFLEKKISMKWDYYNIIKNIYLISIVILIIFMPWASLAGRMSSVFATVEIFIFPSFLYAFKNKITMNFILLIILNLLAYYNIFIRLGNDYIYF